MFIAAIIRKENQILIEQVYEGDNQIIWGLPNCEASDFQKQEALVERCETFNAFVEVTDVFFHEESDRQEIIVFNTDLQSYSEPRNAARWVEVKELNDYSFVEQHEAPIRKIINEYESIYAAQNIFEFAVDAISSEFGVKTETMKSHSDFRVFVSNDYGSYCPFIFRVDYAIASDDSICVMHSWPITRMYAEGDKTDLYVLFSSLMAILLKCVFQNSVYIDCVSLFVSHEINATTILFDEPYPKVLPIKDLSEFAKDIYGKFLLCLMLFEKLIGSFSLVRNDAKFAQSYEMRFSKKAGHNCFAREEHQYYASFKERLSLIVIDNGVFSAGNMLKGHQWEFIEGVDGTILCQTDMNTESFNYIPNNIWNSINKLIKSMNIKDHMIVCQINKLYLLESNRIWIFDGDFDEYQVNEEKEKIQKRQLSENKLLHLNRLFRWKYPVDPGRFEELIADLLETDIMVSGVRIVGKANNPDGGRDLLIYRRHMNETCTYSTALSIGQCKAYEKSVNKSNVRDIRDTLGLYNANGFFLAVTSGITSHLLDHLCKLRESNDVDWWTEREIFKKLRQNPTIADRFSDILLFEN